jgi:hypothetical protein
MIERAFRSTTEGKPRHDSPGHSDWDRARNNSRNAPDSLSNPDKCDAGVDDSASRHLGLELSASVRVLR